MAHLAEHVLQLGLLLTRQAYFAVFTLTEVSYFAGFLLVGHDHEVVTSIWRAVETLDLDRHGGASGIDLLAQLVGQRANAAVVQARQDDVALLQSTVLYQHGRHGTAAFIQT